MCFSMYKLGLMFFSKREASAVVYRRDDITNVTLVYVLENVRNRVHHSVSDGLNDGYVTKWDENALKQNIACAFYVCFPKISDLNVKYQTMYLPVVITWKSVRSADSPYFSYHFYQLLWFKIKNVTVALWFIF